MNFNRILWTAALAVSLCVAGCTAVKNNEGKRVKQSAAPGDLAEPENIEMPKLSVFGPPANQYYYFLRSQLEASAGRMEHAARLLEKAVKEDPDEPVLKRELALAYLELDRKEDALDMAEEMLRHAPDEVESLILAASIRHAAGKYRQAKKAYEKVLEKDPDRENIYLNLARLYLRDREYQETAELLKPFVREFPKNYTGFYFLAEACSEMGELDNAVEAYKKSLEIEPGLQESRIGLIEIYTRRNRKDEVTAQYEKLIERHPDNVAAAIELGLLYEEAGKKDKAEDLWKDFARRVSSDGDEVLEVIRQLMSRNRHDDAISVLSEMLKHSPG